MIQDQQQKETQLYLQTWQLMQLGQQKPSKEMQTKEYVKATQETYGRARNHTQAWQDAGCCFDSLTSSSPLDQIQVFIFYCLMSDEGYFCESN